MRIPIEDRLARKTRREQSGCLVWTGHIEDGYGRAWVDGRMQRVHRIAWQLVHGEIPVGMELDHLCHNRACVEVSHLRLATHAQNGQNRAGAPRHSSTGVRGVRLHPNGRYQVRVAVNGRRHSCGYYESLDEAARVAEQKRAELQDAVPVVEIPLDMTEG